jgi:hypothetical protein
MIASRVSQILTVEKLLLRAAAQHRTFCFAGTPSEKGVAGIRV